MKFEQTNQLSESEGVFISVIISTYNRAKYIGITLDSFLNQSYPPSLYEIIVCDNNSTDNTKEVIESCIKGTDRNIRYLFEKRQGMHYARNYAAQNSQGQILYFTDDDTFADIHLLSELVEIFKNNKVGCATGRVLPRWECTPPKWVEKYCNNALLSLNDQGKRTKIRNYDLGVFGCHEAVRRDVFFQAGGFHPDLIGNTPGVGDGETGLNSDIKEMGYLFAYVGTSVIFHMIPPRRMTQRYLNKRFEYNGNSASYSEYRRAPFTKKELPKRIVAYLLRFLAAEINVVKEWKKGEKNFRFCLAEIYYYRSRIQYDIRIVCNQDFRKFVENNNWF